MVVHFKKIKKATNITYKLHQQLFIIFQEEIFWL